MISLNNIWDNIRSRDHKSNTNEIRTEKKLLLT